MLGTQGGRCHPVRCCHAGAARLRTDDKPRGSGTVVLGDKMRPRGLTVIHVAAPLLSLRAH